MNTQPTNGRRIATRSIAAVALAAVGFATVATTSALAAPNPAEGVACEVLGAHADGTALDCVATPGGQTWRTKGTRPNPYRIGETATVSRWVGSKWVPSYTVQLTSGNADNSANVTPSERAQRELVKPGTRPVSAGISLSLLGPAAKPAPSAGLTMQFVDAADKTYPLYAFKRGEVDCDSPGIKLVNGAKLTQNRGTITGDVCTYVETASINATLLMRVSSNGAKNQVAWFSFL